MTTAEGSTLPVAETDSKNTTGIPVPAEVQEEVKKAHMEVQELTLRLGSLELDYVSAKNNLLAALDKQLKSRTDLLNKTAKDAGLDIENNKWVLDLKTMMLVKQA